ncbi:MAG: CotH kinase family protein [Bacteroidales bacterium]|nr:CotH kinase family protein [Bacteroidales bacterium]
MTIVTAHIKPIRWYVLLLGLLFLPSAQGQLILNEFMASNASTLEDQFNDYPDWIELHNAGEETISLGDYWLSDDLSMLKKWNLPDIKLTGDSYFVVFASGRDIYTDLSYWYTVINTGEEWRYHIPDEELSDQWKYDLDYTSDWMTGKSGIGYGDDDDSTIISPALALYMQKEFEIESFEEVTDGALFMDYDDGFVAYLNGTEIARSPNMGDSGRVVNYNAPAGAAKEAGMYTGLQPEGYFFTKRFDLLRDGSNVLAIEVHNISRSSSDMSAIPFFLLGYNNFRDDLVYGNSYFVIKDKYPHTNFRIKSEGEAIFLSDGNGNIVDQIANIKLPTDFSYGRVPDTAGVYGYYEIPTPGAANGTDYSIDYISDSVRIVLQDIVFNGEQRVVLESDMEDGLIRYTTDGSVPDGSSNIFRGYLSIGKTTVVKARIYRYNNLPGPVSTRTIFSGEGHELPMISVSMDPYDLWDYNEGIYVMGPNASEEAPYHGANFWQDWERPAHLEIYNKEEQLLLSQDAGTKIFGGWSRAHPQKSMSFFARKNYGNGSFSYPLFREKEIDEFEAFVLRNSGNDWCNGNFRDALTGWLAAEMDIDHQAYQPYVMYLNGDYWGFINMREKVNEHFIASNHYVYADSVNILQGNGWLVHGTVDSYKKLYDYVTTNNLDDYQKFRNVQGMMDVDNYMRYWVLNVFINNKDWPGNNIKFWSTSAPGSLFRWISFDTDFGYSIWDHQAYEYNTLEFSFGEGPVRNWANQDWAVSMINSLIDNDNFRRQFINEFADRMNTTFSPDHVIPVIDSFERRLYSEGPTHYDRWIGDPNNWLSFPNWLASVERIREYFRERPTYMRQHLMERFKIQDTLEIGVNVSDAKAGHVRLNSVDLRKYPFTGLYFKDIPVKLRAIPAPGYAFSHWAGDYNGDTAVFNYGMGRAATFIAVFEEIDSTVDIVINEINYASHPNRDTDDWVELYNNSGMRADLSGWSISDGYSRDSFYIPEGTLLPVNGYMVLSTSLPDFKRFFPEPGRVHGNLPFGLNAEGDGVALYDQKGELHDYVIFKSEAPWPEGAKGTGATLELINPGLDNALPGSWTISEVFNGTPCIRNSTFESIETNVNVKASTFEPRAFPSPFKEETFIHFKLDQPEKIAIEFYAITGRLVDKIQERDYPAGPHTLKWQPGNAIEPGIYFVRFRTGSSGRTLKLIYQ